MHYPENDALMIESRLVPQNSSLANHFLHEQSNYGDSVDGILINEHDKYVYLIENHDVLLEQYREVLKTGRTPVRRVKSEPLYVTGSLSVLNSFVGRKFLQFRV